MISGRNTIFRSFNLLKMEQYKKDFIELLVKAQALKFGEFTLKSGRKAPYFLNAGSFYTGELASQLGKFYAAALEDSGIDYDVIFGPAYKGIPLSVITTTALFSEFGKNSAYCFNRKESKDYGDAKGKVLVGAPLDENTRIVIVDDVITAGTAIRETVELLKENGNPQIVGVLIAMNRMEKNNDGVNALAEIEESLGCPVKSIIDLDDVVEVLGPELGGEKLETIRVYREEYGV
jgi:orotate phosphoribosyltransferase